MAVLKRPLIIATWLGGRYISASGNALTMVFAGVYAFHQSGSPHVVALIVFCRLIGTAAGAMSAPYLSRLFSGQTLMMGADLTAAVACLTFIVLPDPYRLPLLPALILVLGICQGVYHVALYAEIPRVAGFERRHSLNGVVIAVEGTAMVTGSLAATLLVASTDARLVLLLDATTFALCAASLFLVKRVLRQREPTKEVIQPKLHISPPSMPSERSTQLLRVVAALIVVRAFEAFGSAGHNVGFPILSEHYDPTRPTLLFGSIMASWGIGRLVSAFINPLVFSFSRRKGVDWELLFAPLVAITFLLFSPIFFFKHLALLLTFAFLAGISDALTEATYYTSLQSSSSAITSRNISLSYIIERSAMGCGILVCGIIFSSTSLTIGISGMYGIASIGAVAFGGFLIRARRGGN